MSRPRKPAGLKLVTGTARADRMNGAEPEPMLLTDLSPPAHLSARSAAVWNEVAPMLRRLHVLTEADVISLEMLCDSVADYRHSREQRGDDFVVHSSKGSEMVSQWLVAQQMSRKAAESFMAKFGMDPVARSRVMVDPQIGLPFGDGAPTGAARHFKAPR